MSIFASKFFFGHQSANLEDLAKRLSGKPLSLQHFPNELTWKRGGSMVSGKSRSLKNPFQVFFLARDKDNFDRNRISKTKLKKNILTSSSSPKYNRPIKKVFFPVAPLLF